MPQENNYFNYQKAHFKVSAAKLSQCPKDIHKEVAFVGRSNVGKSSALNALTGSNQLARTSKTPGRTQLINFFEVHPGFSLVDLPGYGYARVAKSVRESWGKHLNEYLEKRKSLVGMVLLMDIRHPFKAFDTAMIDWATAQSLPLHILLTKSDKISYGAAKKVWIEANSRVSENKENITIQLYSSLKRQGIKELAACLDAWFVS